MSTSQLICNALSLVLSAITQFNNSLSCSLSSSQMVNRYMSSLTSLYWTPVLVGSCGLRNRMPTKPTWLNTYRTLYQRIPLQPPLELAKVPRVWRIVVVPVARSVQNIYQCQNRHLAHLQI
jgi:hypothetical protein